MTNEAPRDDNDLEAIEQLNRARQQIEEQVSRVIVGQRDVLEQLLVAMFAGGHCLLVGVPGLAKTLMIRTLAQSLDLTFRRIQFTPDLMPSDITGTEVIQPDRETGERHLRFVSGPIFGNVVLADEVNRTPPKTQSALLEAMQEHQVTAGGMNHPLPEPFFVLATQNPIDQEGTYPLPEAQLDRFMFHVTIGYPTETEELEIIHRTTSDLQAEVESTITADDICRLTKLVRRVPIAEHVARYALRLVRWSRPESPDAPQEIADYVMWGAGPRASQFLVLGAKARAILNGRPAVQVDDIKAIALPVLRHRIKTNFQADAEGIRPDDLVAKLLEVVPEIATSSDGKDSSVYRSAGSGED